MPERKTIELIDVAGNAFTAGISRNRSRWASSARNVVATDGLEARGGLRELRVGNFGNEKNFR
jgi:hypothetical protein